MVSQTILPEKWVIVSDGSTDATDEIVQRYALMYSWIEFIRMPYHSDRQFAAKVYAFNAGYKKIKDTAYDIIGNLDADISLANLMRIPNLVRFDELFESKGSPNQ